MSSMIVLLRRAGASTSTLSLALALGLCVLFGWAPLLAPERLRMFLCGLTAVSSAVLMHRVAQLFNPARLSIPSFFLVSYVIMIYLPAFVVYGEQPDPTRTIYLFAVQSVLLTVPLGIWAANVAARYSKRENDRFYASPMVAPADTSAAYHVALLMFLASALVMAVYFSELEFGRIPLVYMFTDPGDVDMLQSLREESFKLFDPRWNTASSSLMFYAFLFLRTLLFPFLIVIAFGYFLCTRRRDWMWLFILSAAFGGFYAAASIARAPLAALVMRVMFVYYLFRGGNMGRRATTTLLGLMLAFPVLVTTMAYGSKGIMDALTRVAKRFTYTPADDLYVYFEMFPNHVAYQYGGTLLKPVLKLFELPYFYIENQVFLYQFPNGLLTGHANAAFISNLHADFGPPGVVLGGFLIGALMQGVQIWLARKPKTVVNVAIFAFMMYAFWVLNFGSITSVLGTNGVLPVMVLAWGFIFLTDVVRVVGRRGKTYRMAASRAS